MRYKPKSVGFYRLMMKNGSDNFRSAAVLDVIQHVKEKGAEVFIYEPTVHEQYFLGCPVVRDITHFKKYSSVIVTNRKSDQLADVETKIFSRDIFGDN